MEDDKKRHPKYVKKQYSYRQVRDTVAGSDAVKRGNETYLPMPSGMTLFDASPSNERNAKKYANIDYVNFPWYHHNPAYRAYMQRALFPDYVGSVLRGLCGIATREDIVKEGPKEVFEIRSTKGKDIDSIYAKVVREIAQIGKICAVLDVTSTGEYKIALYAAERHPDWLEELIDGEVILTKSTFVEKFGSDTDGNEEETIKYWLDDEGFAVSQRYVGDIAQGEPVQIERFGKKLTRLPIFFGGSTENSPDPDDVPMLGLSDIALTAYRKDADLSHAQFMTCNPTLFLFGVSKDQEPKMIGSSVVVTVSNPQASAIYPATDTTALQHVADTIKGLAAQAISAGAQIMSVGPRGSAESAEALAIREAASGATLLDFVTNAGDMIEDLLTFATEWSGSSEEVIFRPSTYFADKKMTAEETTSMVGSWVQGAISHDTLLDNLRSSNIVAGNVSNDKEKERILTDKENGIKNNPPEQGGGNTDV